MIPIWPTSVKQQGGCQVSRLPDRQTKDRLTKNSNSAALNYSLDADRASFLAAKIDSCGVARWFQFPPFSSWYFVCVTRALFRFSVADFPVAPLAAWLPDEQG
jgi:hypothetical protein